MLTNEQRERIISDNSLDTIDAVARAIEADLVSRDVPACRVADRGFRWDGDRQEHVPRLVVEFDAVPFDAPADSKGWVDRDRLAAMLAPHQPQPGQAQPSEQCRGLLNLLARIHGDGGHYVATHGIDKAVEDADQLVAVWRAEKAQPSEGQP